MTLKFCCFIPLKCVDSPEIMKTGQKIFNWYQKNKRNLPWRKNARFYCIWISEVMLQQTTVRAVIPYYKKFIKKFPTLKSLAQSPLEEVLPYWAGLGYYSRVQNLHKSAQMFFKEKKIPQKADQLKKYPGFGPYISKAVSSIAFGEFVSVMDGNVIRVLCRHENLKVLWWKNTKKLEQTAQNWSLDLPIGDMNQALMELGAIICTPKSPLCSQCPVKTTCQAKRLNKINQLPLKKTRKKKEIWVWRPQVNFKNNKVLLTQEHSCPFLKNSWLFPGSVQKKKTPPQKYDFKHSITHHDIFICLSKKQSSKISSKWYSVRDLQKINPSSLLQKVLKKQTINLS